MLCTFATVAAPTWAISGAGAALRSTDFSGLNDGRPGTQTRLQGCTSAVNPTILTATGFSLAAAAGQPYYLIVGILNATLATASATSIAVNGAWGAAGTLTQALVQYPKALAPPPAQQPYINAWYVLTPSQLSGSTPITQLTVNLTTASASQVFAIGEIMIGLAFDVPVDALEIQWDDSSKLNRSSGNQPYTVLRKPFRKTSCNVAPQTFIQSFGNSANGIALADFFYAMDVQAKLAIIPSWHQAGSSSVDTDMIQRMAQAVRGLNFGALKSMGPEQFYSVPLAFEELL